MSVDITKTENYKLLRHDPEARLVIYCKNRPLPPPVNVTNSPLVHGNAGHIAQAIRPPTFHALTDTSNYHVLAIDYRGFGRSTGSPTEKGLILDAATAINWAMDVAGIPASRIVLLGHSLGTAVAAATAELFAKDGVDFAGVVLVASFSSLPTMLSGYAIAGYVPVLAPFRLSPWLLRQVMKCIVDKWESAARLRSLTRMIKARGGRLRLSLVHAKNDWDIPFHEDDKMFAGAVGGLIEGLDGERLAADKAARTVQRGKDAFVTTWTEGDIVIRQELFAHGGKISHIHPLLFQRGVTPEQMLMPVPRTQRRLLLFAHAARSHEVLWPRCSQTRITSTSSTLKIYAPPSSVPLLPTSSGHPPSPCPSSSPAPRSSRFL